LAGSGHPVSQIAWTARGNLGVPGTMTTTPFTTLQLEAALALSSLNSLGATASNNAAARPSVPMLVSPFLAPSSAIPLDSVTPELLGLLYSRAQAAQHQGRNDLPLQGQWGCAPSGTGQPCKGGGVSDAATALALSRLLGTPLTYGSPSRPVAAASPDLSSLAGFIGARAFSAAAATPTPPLTSPRSELQVLHASMRASCASSGMAAQVHTPAAGAKRSPAQASVDEDVQGPAKRMAIASILSSRGDDSGVAHQARGREGQSDLFNFGPHSEAPSRPSSTGSDTPACNPIAHAKVRSSLELEEGGSSNGGAAFLRFLRCMEDLGVVVRHLQREGQVMEVVGWAVVEGKMEDWRRLRKEWFMNGKEGKVYKPNSMYQVMRRLGFFPTLRTRRTSHGCDFEYGDTYVLDKSKRYGQSYARGGSRSPRAPRSPQAASPTVEAEGAT